MTADPGSPTDEPGMAEVGFYFGTGAFFAFVLVAAIGLSIYGYHRTADARDARVAAGAAATDAEDVDRGGEIYDLRCASCHGAGGEGGVGPSFVGVVDRFPDVADHVAIVAQGRGTMPGFEGILSDSQIELVVGYEREVLDG